ncbi:lipocalin family protein [Capnocytophaga canis]|uniref:lipocalin family protein n=1 Tax=Capnocytophaga canis TaxID=1848903 RepID=UPI00385C17B0
MKKFFMLALIAVSMLTVSCGKNSDDTQPENVRLVGTWKCVKIERVEDGKRINPREVKDDGCTKYVFTDKVSTYFFINDEEGGKCMSEEGSYRIENGRIYNRWYKEESQYGENDFGFKFIDNDTFEFFEDTSDGKNGLISTYKRVK